MRRRYDLAGGGLKKDKWHFRPRGLSQFLRSKKGTVTIFTQQKWDCPLFSRLISLLVLIVGGLSFEASPIWAQTAERKAPTSTYFAAFNEFYAGDYKTALDRFQAEARGCIKNGQFRWIDSICYETMIGECYYHTGDLNKALEHYSSALEIFAAFSDWMLRVQFLPIRPAATGARKPVPWGASTRHSKLGEFPSSVLIGQGRINNNDVIQKGGVVQQAVYYSIQPQEIVRCTTLALRRRAELLGPISKNDPLTEKLVSALSRPINPLNHWSEAWADVQRGLALVAAGKENQGIPCLQRSLIAQGEFDHPMTSIALLELGRLALIRGDYPAAAKFFEEATYTAVDYPDQGVLEEAFRYAAITHLIANRKDFYAPLPAAWQWAKRYNYQQLRVSLALSAAENYSVLGQIKEAAVMLDDARNTLGRRKTVGRLGVRLGYLSAMLLFQEGKTQEGQAAFKAAMSFMQQGSFRLFQIALADTLYTSGAAAPRSAMEYYNELLRDPLPNDWSLDPMETLAVLVTPHPLSYEHWFEVAWERQKETAWEIADRARRNRFFCSLDMGGRLQSLRWILESPAESLDQQSLLQRRDLSSRWPQYAQLSEQARALRAKLADMPLVSEDQASFKEQSKALGELSSLSAQQEAILREIALCREPAGMIFPPQKTMTEIRKSLPNGHAILAFFIANRRLYATLISNSNYNSWEVNAPLTLMKQITALLHDMGQYQQNHELTLKELADVKWTQSAVKVLDALLKGSRADLSKSFDELIIVPDGMLWCLPFDALQVSVDGQLQALISRFRIRYAPTVSLAFTTQAQRLKPAANTAVILGKLYPGDDESVAKNAFEHLSAALPGTVALKSPLPGPTADYKVFFDRLIVLDDLAINDQEPYAWTPAPIARAKSGVTLGDWMALPWGGPEQIILPGFHTAAEDAMKRTARGAPGDELFLSVCGLMSCGARTILLSRWRSGGQSSFDLVREFAQELPHTLPADAWQRAVILETSAPLNIEAEPRIKRASTDETPKANHPLFWAGYILIDSGQVSQKTPEPKAPEPEKPQDKAKSEKQAKEK